MIESVVTLAPANVQQTKALVLKCCRVGWTHRLLVRRTVVITNTAGIKCRESFADGMVIASNVCARVYIFRAKKNKTRKSALVWIANWPDVLHSLREQLLFNFLKFFFVFPVKTIDGRNGELLFLQYDAVLIWTSFFYNFFLRDLITGFYSANCLTLFVFEFISSIWRLTQRRNVLIIGRTGMRDNSLKLKNKQI